MQTGDEVKPTEEAPAEEINIDKQQEDKAE